MAFEQRNGDPDRLQIPELPTLEPGITLLETDEDPRYPLQTLAIDELLLHSGSAIWLSVGRYCTTDTIVDIAPDRRVLERIHIARGFNPYQHSTLVDALDAQITADTAVNVAPNLDGRYRDGDLRAGEPRDMRLHHDGDTVEMHVDEEGVGHVDEEPPEWVESVAERMGLFQVR